MSIHLRLRTGALAVAVGLIFTPLPAGLALAGAGPAGAVSDSATTLKNTPLDVAAPGVLGNDQILAGEPGAASYEVCTAAPGFEGNFRSLSPRIVSEPGKGTLSLAVDGAYRFVPAVGFVGMVVFNYSLANIDELPQCPINPRMNATLTIEVVATTQGSFDGTFTPVAAQTGPCIIVDTTSIAFGDVPNGSTAWAAPGDSRTTTLSSCSPIDQIVNGTVSAALGVAAPPVGAVSLDPTDRPVPSVSQFSYGLAARAATEPRPAAPGQVLTAVPSGVVTLQGGSGVATIEHYLIGPAAGTLVAGTGFQFAVTFVAFVRA